MTMSNLEIFCVTNKKVFFLENTNYNLAAVGKGDFNKNYIRCDDGDNIYYKEKNYSELTFHYWLWKNGLNKFNDDTWIALCQRRRFWLNSRKNDEKNKPIKDKILNSIPDEWSNFDSVICEPIHLGTKLSKLIKRGWKNLLFKPSLIFNHKKITIKEHFDMHHGFGTIEKAANLLGKNDKKDFLNYISSNTKFNPHIMCVAKKKILNSYFKDQFKWLFECEKVFGFKGLKNYDQTRLYAFLAERYLSFWFKKYSNYTEWPWLFYEENKNE